MSGHSKPPGTVPEVSSAPPSSSPVPPPSAGGPFAAPRPNRIPLFIAAAVVVVVVLILLVLILPTGSNSSSAGAQSYSQARPSADGAASNYQGGGWALVLAAGIDSASSETSPLNLSALGGANCSFQPAPGLSSEITLPAYIGNRSAGLAPAWVFGYRDGAGAIAIVTVLNGHATVLGTLSGSLCTTIFGLLSAIPAGVIDSPAAAKAVAPFAQPFLSLHPNASAEFTLVGGISFLGKGTGPEWEVTYSTCTLGPSASGTGTQFNATVNAVSGAVTYSQTTPSIACGSSTTSAPTPIGSVLAFGSAGLSTSGGYTNYSFLVLTASSGIRWVNLTASVETGSGVTVNSGWVLDAVTPAGVTVATYDPTTQVWTGSPTQAILAGDSLTLRSSTSLSGDLLILTGTGSFGGTMTLPI
jgi:hypothetical protein